MEGYRDGGRRHCHPRMEGLGFRVSDWKTEVLRSVTPFQREGMVGYSSGDGGHDGTLEEAFQCQSDRNTSGRHGGL